MRSCLLIFLLPSSSQQYSLFSSAISLFIPSFILYDHFILPKHITFLLCASQYALFTGLRDPFPLPPANHLFREP